MSKLWQWWFQPYVVVYQMDHTETHLFLNDNWNVLSTHLAGVNCNTARLIFPDVPRIFLLKTAKERAQILISCACVFLQFRCSVGLIKLLTLV